MKQIKDQEFHHKRSLGQNFITDDALFSQLVDLAGVGENDAVLEIGAGAGGHDQGAGPPVPQGHGD